METTPNTVQVATSNNHIKPSKEELQGNIDKIMSTLEEKSAEPEEKKVEPSKEQKEEIKEPEEKKEQATVESEKKEQVEEAKADDEYKKKFVESQRQAYSEMSKNRKINEAIEEAKKLPDPTEEELAKEYPEWDIMSDTEKRLAKKTYIADKRFSFLDQVTTEAKNLDMWHEKVDTFADNPATLNKYQDLEGKTDEFKLFAGKKAKMGADLDDLVAAFLWDQSKQAKPASKGSMFETGTGGENEKPKNGNGKLSFEEGTALMKANYNEWRRLKSAGMIEDAVL